MQKSYRGKYNDGSFNNEEIAFLRRCSCSGYGFRGSAWADVLVGIGVPVTGPNAVYGAQIQKGAEAAIKEVNDAGGINGEKIAITVGDDVSDPKQGISVANKFAADGVKFVIGHFNSGVTIPASQVYAENGILEISPGATNPQYTEQGLWNTFRTCGRDDQQGIVAGQYIFDHFKDAKIAVIHDKTPMVRALPTKPRRSSTNLVPKKRSTKV